MSWERKHRQRGVQWAVDVSPTHQATPEFKLMCAMVEQWADDVVSEVPEIRLDALLCLRPGYSPVFEWACEITGLDLGAVADHIARHPDWRPDRIRRIYV